MVHSKYVYIHPAAWGAWIQCVKCHKKDKREFPLSHKKCERDTVTKPTRDEFYICDECGEKVYPTESQEQK